MLIRSGVKYDVKSASWPGLFSGFKDGFGEEPRPLEAAGVLASAARLANMRSSVWSPGPGFFLYVAVFRCEVFHISARRHSQGGIGDPSFQMPRISSRASCC